MGRGAWRTAVNVVTKSDTTEPLSTAHRRGQTVRGGEMGQRVGQGQKVHPRNARVDNACVLVWKQLGSVTASEADDSRACYTE